MNTSEIEIRLTQNVGAEDHPSAKAMDELMTVMMASLMKSLANEETRFLEIPPPALIIMITNNILMNLFLRFYSGQMGTLIEDAETIADDLKKIFIDCVQKVFLSKADETKPN